MVFGAKFRKKKKFVHFMESIQLKSGIISDKFVKKLCNFQIYYGTMAYSGYMLKNFFQEPVRYGLAEESCKKRGLLFF